MARDDGRTEVQHYVPRLLLRGFLRQPHAKEQVFVYDKHEDRSFPTNITNIAAERKFYDFDADDRRIDVEGILSELESNIKPALEILIKSESLAALDDAQKSWLSIFLATQQLRTRHFREVIKAVNDGTAQHIKNRGFDPRETEGFEPIETEDDLKRASMALLARSMGRHSRLMSTKASFLVKTSYDRPFWISDHPLVMHNDRNFGPYGNIGLAVPGIQIYLPLTSTLLLALWCTTIADTYYVVVEQAKREQKRLSVMQVLGRHVDMDEIERQLVEWQTIVNDREPLLNALKNGSSVEATADNVTFYNHLQVRWSHRHLISSIDDFALAKKMISDNSKFRTGFMPKLD